jgi:regulator of sigma E protease
LSLSWQHLLAFLVAVGLLVTVHEFGHYWVARRLGFKVLRFSIGFGKPLWKRVAGVDRTEYAISPIPLGGYVKLLDEREGPVDPAELHRAFNRRPHWQRILVLLAGPAANIVFAIVLLAAAFWSQGVNEVRPVIGEVLSASPAFQAGIHTGDEIIQLNDAVVLDQGDVVFGLLQGMSGDGRVSLRLRDAQGLTREVDLSVLDAAERRRLTEPENLLRGLGFGFWRPSVPAVLVEILADGAASKAGLLAGDEVLAFNGNAVADFEDLRRRVEALPGESVPLRIRRAGSEIGVRVEIASAEEAGKKVGRLGIKSMQSAPLPAAMIRHTEVGPLQALGMGARKSWEMTALQGQVFWRMLMGQVSLKNLSGPLTIAEYAGDSASNGVAAFTGFLVLISLSLGFLNLLPIPILDGGQIIYQLVEWIKGSPLSERAQIMGQQVGMGLLVLLMGVALFNDIVRQFG